MKVLFLCYRGNPYCGGQGIYLYNLTRELSKHGVEVDVLVGPPYPDPMEEWARVIKIENLNIWSVKTRHIPVEKLKRIFDVWNFTDYVLTRFHIFSEMQTFSLRAFQVLRDLIKNNNYDLIHDVQCLGWGLLAMKGFGIPVITTVHHPLTFDRQADFMTDRTLWEYITTVLFYPLLMQKFVINRLDRVVTSSRRGIMDLKKAFGISPEKVSIVYNGMDTDLFRNNGLKREQRSLLFVGNAEDRKKDIFTLLKALSMLEDDISLTVVDEGPPLKNVAWKMVEELGLQKRVFFTGRVDSEKLANLYSEKTILVMSSLHEGFGLPAAEAMACGTPVVVTDAGALREVVGDEGAGLIVPPGDPQALKDSILTLLNNRELREKMGRIGRKRAEEKFSWPVAALNTLKVYEDVIAKYRSGQ